MTVAFPVCRKDCEALLRLLRWIERLGPQQQRHEAVILADADTPYQQCIEARDICQRYFGACRLLATEESVQGWPQGANALFRLACSVFAGKKPFLWLEPDAVPLKPNWLDAIADEYAKCGQPFLGHVYQTNNPKFPAQCLSGVAVYPLTAASFVAQPFDDSKAFDVACSPYYVPETHNSRLIQHFWGQPGLPPTFALRKTAASPVNTFTLDNLWPEAVIFHRNKDGTLISLLSGEPLPCTDLMVVFPFCNKDAAMMQKMLRWCQELAGKYDADALISYEQGTNDNAVRAIRQQVKATFRAMGECCYPPPPRGFLPQTWAFKHAAEFVYKNLRRPFVWMEYDAIPLKPGWIDALAAEYVRTGKAFMGPIVQGMGHMNGTGVYPGDAAVRIAKAINYGGNAWDVSMRGEMIHDCHNCGHLFQHAWGVERQRLHPFIGNAPSFRSVGDLRRWLLPTAVVFHRCKDGSLIDRLREQKKYPK